MKFVALAILGSLFLTGCTGGKEDSAKDTAVDSAAE